MIFGFRTYRGNKGDGAALAVALAIAALLIVLMFVLLPR